MPNNILSIYEITEFILKKSIILVSIIITCAVVSLAYSFNVPNTYKSDIVVYPSESVKSQSQGMQGLSSFIGLNLDTTTSSTAKNLAYLESKTFIIDFIKENNLLNIIFEDEWNESDKKWKNETPSFLAAYASFTNKFLFIKENKTNGLITVSIITKDPEISSFLANQIVKDVNNFIRAKDLEETEKNMQFLREQLSLDLNIVSKTYISEILKSQTTKLMRANVTEDYAFVVIDPALAPLNKYAPSKLKILISGISIGIVICFIFLLITAFKKEYKVYLKKD